MKMQRKSKQHEYELGKLYELIINTNPPVAYLMVGNNMTEQRTVLCHIQGHSHYFKHNRLFRATDLDGNAATDLTISTSSPH